jgi:putative peptidoglycan lipid II flippase
MTPGVKKVMLLSGPGIVSGGIMQVNLLIATMIATTFERAVPYLYYADRLYQLPLGVIGVAIGVVLLPDLSRKLRAGNEQGALTSQNRAMELSLFLTLPATVALIVIAMPLINALFEHGEFTHSDTLAVAPTLAAFAAGLPAFSMTKVFQPGYFAREDTRTPMQIAMLSVMVNIIGSLLLSRFYAHVGIAMATAIAAWVNTACLGVILHRRGCYAADSRLKDRLPRMLLASLGMGAVLFLLNRALAPAFVPGASAVLRLAALSVLVTAGGLAYFGFGHVFKAMTVGELRAMLRR